jgi:hypothetical protein
VHRHRWGLAALATYLAGLGTIKLLLLGPGYRATFAGPESFALVVVVPLAATFTYLLAVFSFGLSGDLAGRRSIYPTRLFTLPVTTDALAGWPMLYGTTAMALLWLATRRLAVWPADIAVPVVWPALLAAALLAWTQALTWMPYGLPGLRVLVTVVWLSVVDMVALVALQLRVPESVMAALLVPQLPLAFLVARRAVARARRGDVPDWLGAWTRPSHTAAVWRRPPNPFSSAARAQRWHEWRRHGRLLPALVAILLPFETGLLFVARHDPSLAGYTLLGVLLTPPFLAVFAAPSVSEMTPFLATRPATSAALLAAKLHVTVRSTLAAWLLVLVAIPLALTLSATWPVVAARASDFAQEVGTPRAVVLALLGIVGLVAATWRQLAQSLYLSLTGRAWLVRGRVFAMLALLFFLGPIVQWIADHGDVQGRLWDALPWVLACLVGVKMSAAAGIIALLFRHRLLTDRALVTGAAAWCGTVLALYAVLVWILSAPFLPRYLVALIAILAVPLARLSAAPLALAWNRQR